ncbi:MBL fold metallo-hydrolase [Fluviispira multicolorata]|uniref:Metallo-beta-lactamase domain-containing protein n=1 Tax=Fluviispira multicolorata TaxID=2654512 RepID=A0A833JCP7_9BACT|nr:MBL fold metallo-hydrolase [Fluviispira multicolorata]KAB8030851.1 hypothetical protein GCL57_07710 [Fluviispira multicolorata]
MAHRSQKSKSPKKTVLSTNSSLPGTEQFVTFWGVRGTIPIPDQNMLKYGGNTSCIEVLNISPTKHNSIIFDAGTGIIKCCENALLRGDRVFHLFFSHMHYDHIIGLTKFIPFFRKDCKIHIYGQAKISKSLKEIIQHFFISPFFPVEFYQLPSLNNIFFHELNGLNHIDIEGIRIDIQPLNHPQEALAYRIWSEDKKTSIVYATDHEHGSNLDIELEKFIKGTDIFIYDSTFSENNYKNHIGWGHSTAKEGATLAKSADVKSYIIFHHDPSSTDIFLEEKILCEAKKIFEQSFLATEYQTINVSELHTLLTTK